MEIPWTQKPSLPSIPIDFWPKNKLEFNRNKTVPPIVIPEYCTFNFSIGFEFSKRIYHFPL